MTTPKRLILSMPPNLADNTRELKMEIFKKADRCVKCGLCSAQCPTYLVDQSENESPRGRISLMQAVASDQLAITPVLSKHINNCLSCGRCEKSCPSGVEFGSLMASMRQIVNDANPSKVKYSVVNAISNLSLTHWTNASKLFWIARKLGFFRLFSQLKPYEKYINRPKYTPAKTQHDNSVYLFTGCTSQFLDAKTIESAQHLLNLCEVNIIMPKNQICCGALPYHKGYLTIADQCKQKNQTQFDQPSIPIVHLAAACGMELEKYEDKFSHRVIDISSFLANNATFKRLQFKPLKKRILIHMPCTLKNKSIKPVKVDELLTHIPGVELIHLNENTICCGAAGDYMLTHQDKSKKIRTLAINEIIAINPDIVISSNYTCGINLENGLREKNLDITVMHPIELLGHQVIN